MSTLVNLIEAMAHFLWTSLNSPFPRRNLQQPVMHFQQYRAYGSAPFRFDPKLPIIFPNARASVFEGAR